MHTRSIMCSLFSPSLVYIHTHTHAHVRTGVASNDKKRKHEEVDGDVDAIDGTGNRATNRGSAKLTLSRRLDFQVRSFLVEAGFLAYRCQHASESTRILFHRCVKKILKQQLLKPIYLPPPLRNFFPLSHPPFDSRALLHVRSSHAGITQTHSESCQGVRLRHVQPELHARLLTRRTPPPEKCPGQPQRHLLRARGVTSNRAGKSGGRRLFGSEQSPE